MRPCEIVKIVEYIKEQTGHTGDIFININDNAIPIEFIKQLIEKFDCERGNAIKDTFAHILTGLLEFWEFEQEKENEKDI